MDIGNKIRQLRKKHRLSIKELAEKSECTPSFISQIERNLANPSINSLKKISEVLEVPLIYFFEEPSSEEEDYIVRKESRKKFNSPNEKVDIYLLSPNHLERNIEMHLMVIEPGGQSDKMYVNDTEEVGYVLEGELTLYLEEEEYVVRKGDSIYFPGNIPHGWKNNTDKPVTTIWAVTPPIIKK